MLNLGSVFLWNDRTACCDIKDSQYLCRVSNRPWFLECMMFCIIMYQDLNQHSNLGLLDIECVHFSKAWPVMVAETGWPLQGHPSRTSISILIYLAEGCISFRQPYQYMDARWCTSGIESQTAVTTNGLHIWVTYRLWMDSLWITYNGLYTNAKMESLWVAASWMKPLPVNGSLPGSGIEEPRHRRWWQMILVLTVLSDQFSNAVIVLLRCCNMLYFKIIGSADMDIDIKSYTYTYMDTDMDILQCVSK